MTSSAYDSPLAKKLNLKSGMTLRVVAAPPDVDLTGLRSSEGGSADGVLVFVQALADVEPRVQPVLDACAAGGLAWMAYPKAKQLGTDLNRDILWKHMLPFGVQPVRQISIDDTWSAMRFKKAG